MTRPLMDHCHHLQGRPLEQIEFMDNAFAEALSPNQCHQCAGARAPEQRSPPKAGFYASIFNVRQIDLEQICSRINNN